MDEHEQNNLISRQAAIDSLWIEVKQDRDMSRIAAEIEMRRHEMGLNQKQMAQFLGVPQETISKYESGEYNFTIGTLNEICHKIGLVFKPVVYDPQEIKANIKGDQDEHYEAESSIPISWIEKYIDWLNGLESPFSTITALQVSLMVHRWKGDCPLPRNFFPDGKRKEDE